MKNVQGRTGTNSYAITARRTNKTQYLKKDLFISLLKTAVGFFFIIIFKIYLVTALFRIIIDIQAK